jgi:hypothetical protein
MKSKLMESYKTTTLQKLTVICMGKYSFKLEIQFDLLTVHDIVNIVSATLNKVMNSQCGPR